MLKTSCEENKKKKSSKRLLIGFAFICVVVIFCLKFYRDYSKRPDLPSITSADFNRRVLGQDQVLGEEEVKKQAVLSGSENFSVTQLNVNGGVGLSDALIDFENSGLLVVSNAKSELYSVKDGDKDEVKAIISCQTNKKTTLEIEYLKSGEKVAQVVKDAYFGLNHVLIIPALEFDSVYHYSIRVRDSMGNIANSDQFVFYTGAPNISLLDVLSNATEKVFGWAMKK